MEPITRLTRKGEAFNWTTECEQAYQYIKTRYHNAPILIGVDWKLEFHVHTDASDIAVGAMLAQNPTSKTDQPIAYASRLLSKAEKNYTTTKKEALAMVYAVNKFRHYLLGNKFIFYVDHLALQYLVNKPQVSGRLARGSYCSWSLTLKSYINQAIPTMLLMPFHTTKEPSEQSGNQIKLPMPSYFLRNRIGFIQS